MAIEEKIKQADDALIKNDLPLAKELIDQLEIDFSTLDNNLPNMYLLSNFGGILIDYGSWVNDLKIIKRGVRKIKKIEDFIQKTQLPIAHFYNLANGYASMRKFTHFKAFENGMIPVEYTNEKGNYRKAIQIASIKKLEEHEKKILPDLYTNYGNTLDAMGRPVEALEFFNRALVINPNKPEALGNKAITLKHLAFYAYGYPHLFILEAKRLLELALDNSPHPQLKKYLIHHQDQIHEFISTHKSDLKIEQYKTSTPKSTFHKFLREFCFKYGLYLTPSTLIGAREHQFFGDPLFISKMVADLEDTNKFDRYITFFNQIKQDYIFARYLLVQSQYRANHVDVIDQDVDYYYPLDYSITSSYGEMLKVSYRLAVDTLDKIGFFIKDYCKIMSPAVDEVNFRNAFSPNNRSNELRPEIKHMKNKYLYGLMDLASDMKRDGYYSFIYNRRNALTHRFISIHSELMVKGGENKDIPRIHLQDFIDETIHALKILKSAIIYLILFVDVEEKKSIKKGVTVPIIPTKVEGVLRWEPYKGDKNV
ncbi:MAG TPA: hypothetical protein G4N92_06830 [Anaerolineae bacterium]|nr:hypothetical protein [Anaerolineae bacterium]